MTRKLWLLLPAYNEAESLPRLLPAIDAAMTKHHLDYQLVVVDDGSSDETGAIARAHAEHMPITVLPHPINRGLGETERDGFEHIAREAAREDVIVRMDCDDTHDPEYVLSLLEKLDEGYDVVNTSRFQPGGGQLGVDAYRATISRAANLFMKALFQIPGTRDYSCGYRAYRAAVIKDAVAIFGNFFIQLRGLGFTSTLEMIVKLHLMGCRFAEVPFVLRYDKKASPSKMVTSVTTAGYFTMALLYHWPLGGWASQFDGLAELYREDPAAAVERYGIAGKKRRVPSQIGF